MKGVQWAPPRLLGPGMRHDGGCARLQEEEEDGDAEEGKDAGDAQWLLRYGGCSDELNEQTHCDATSYADEQIEELEERSGAQRNSRWIGCRGSGGTGRIHPIDPNFHPLSCICGYARNNPRPRVAQQSCATLPVLR